MAYRLSGRARADLNEIYWYVAIQTGSLAAAIRVVEAIAKRFLMLVEHPRLGRARDSDLGRGLRSFPVNDHVIIYRIVRAGLQIVRVLHGQRDLPVRLLD